LLLLPYVVCKREGRTKYRTTLRCRLIGSPHNFSHPSDITASPNSGLAKSSAGGVPQRRQAFPTSLSAAATSFTCSNELPTSTTRVRLIACLKPPSVAAIFSSAAASRSSNVSSLGFHPLMSHPVVVLLVSPHRRSSPRNITFTGNLTTRARQQNHCVEELNGPPG